MDESSRYWGQNYPWPEDGDEWSADWGGAETQWHSTILPRIRRFLPARRVLEIAPGRGRWSGYLIAQAESYHGIDVAPECVAYCRKRFVDAGHARFDANDGQSLPGIEDGSIDFAFSYDSLVHVEIDTLNAYSRELARTLAPDGVAFIHHSNLGEFNTLLSRGFSGLSARSRLAARVLRGTGLSERNHWRGASVTAAKALLGAQEAGLNCIAQEIVSCGRKEIDCFSVLARPGSRWDRPYRLLRNPSFSAEARSATAVAHLYASLPSA
ncbi:MAG TPA: class I SAM-dependent methyltransferase [Allosphingosinicella sp.]|jgi:SAM-dependent methyltransferase